jgi:hypothetical protein
MKPGSMETPRSQRKGFWAAKSTMWTVGAITLILVARTRAAGIRKALGVSEPYSSGIQAGKRIPRPRHWQVLAQLVGVSQD